MSATSPHHRLCWLDLEDCHYTYEWKQILRYWNTLVDMDENRLMKQEFIESYTFHLPGKKSWVRFFTRNMTCVGLPFSGLSPYHAPTI